MLARNSRRRRISSSTGSYHKSESTTNSDSTLCLSHVSIMETQKYIMSLCSLFKKFE